ncbi:hypothetical protein F5Y16DRAFT_371114 [Xylariaceae sp. FL0255]|nr:hypothetical protein F5Y16DRAFT_371114 [Xylariaceae sp. FL0255]
MAGPLRPLIADEPTTLIRTSIVPSKKARIPKQIRHRHTPEDWNRLKSAIIRLYIEENRKVDDVIKVLASEGFHTCRRRLLSQLKEWGEVKTKRKIPGMNNADN